MGTVIPTPQERCEDEMRFLAHESFYKLNKYDFYFSFHMCNCV